MKPLFQRPFRKSPKETTNFSISEKTTPSNLSEKLILPPFSTAFAQSKGLQRDHNEDALFTLTSFSAMQDATRPFGIFAVADGMGGHLHGEIASKLAVSSVASLIVERILSPYVNPSLQNPPNSLQSLLREAVMTAHQEVLKFATGGGTTLTICLLLGSFLTIAHVGDSRVYYIDPNGEIKLYTRDHSLVKRLVELGQISEKEAATHPQRNVLYRALGQGEPLEPDIISLPLPHNGVLMLCTDGLWSVVPEQKIIQLIHQSENLQTACTELIEAANQAGGPDNISVILVKFIEE